MAASPQASNKEINIFNIRGKKLWQIYIYFKTCFTWKRSFITVRLFSKVESDVKFKTTSKLNPEKGLIIDRRILGPVQVLRIPICLCNICIRYRLLFLKLSHSKLFYFSHVCFKALTNFTTVIELSTLFSV